MKILMILTSHSALGNTGRKTGYWIEEFAAPFYVFQQAGADISIASPKGGLPPIDPASELQANLTPAANRFKIDVDLQRQLNQTLKLSTVSADDYDAVFFPGGHGPLWDLTNDAHSIRLIESFWNNAKPIAAVCHAPAVLLHVQDHNGQSLLRGKNVTAFSNSEEEAMQLSHVVPFSLEDELKKNGASYSKRDNWVSYVVSQGLLITGQNPASSEAAAAVLIKALKKEN